VSVTIPQRRAWTSLALVSVLLLASSRATAAPPVAAPAGTDEADALFEDGRRLMDEGALTEACPKLERSFQLNPRLGTMLNLGSCFERRGELARALSLYERAATLARQLGRADREAAARELAATLEAKVAKLLVVSEEPSANLVIQVDGEMLSTRAGLVPLDAGERRFVARMPGRVPFEVQLHLKRGETTTVTIPKLREVPAPAAEPVPSGGSLRTVAIVSGFALTAAGIGVGTFFGVRASSKSHDSSSMCDASGCTPQGLRLVEDAQAAGNLSTAFFVAGAVALAATITVLLLGPKPAARAASSGLRFGPGSP
jgi:tetratricopeptide (TPR) repeat protein